VHAVDFFSGIGKTLIILGLVITVVGIALVLVPKAPWIGKLPGDIAIKKDNYQFFFPITTCILVSIVLSILFYLLRK
jgi:uncharacterized protein HemY